ncbi:MAG TPA: deoxyguanosinetriphosphate triphosphohydrolase [Xanthobacteraceae bacterium]|jgi:dGTPase|nr:deoxyguanosinetriphosphate triphosphohydrolase [Xanthobacteraceae bacterium]
MAVVAFVARAPFAANPAETRGRAHAEPESPTRNAFRRDCDRIIHSSAFRRLAHKTQVFVFHEGDHFRTRLTHTLEVTQIARSLARALGLDEDLAEALALAHDLGHPPFGHAGERALDRCLAEHEGFDHNAQTLRVVTALERRYAAFDGLNLTWETLEGVVKHNGPLTDAQGEPLDRYRERGLPPAIKAYTELQDLELWSWPSGEAQAAALADDIAYDAHDIDDGLRAGLFTLDDLAELNFVRDMLAEVRQTYGRLDGAREQHELIRRLITRLIEDVIAETGRRLSALAPSCASDLRRAGTPTVAFSGAMVAADRAIKGFLSSHMYRHARVARIMGEAESVVCDLFTRYAAAPELVPLEWAQGAGEMPGRLRRIADFIAGMTDRYALVEHARLFPVTPELR